MNDLISRQAVLDVLIPILNKNNDMFLAGIISAAVLNIPTAYNVEAVVRELEAIKKDRFKWCEMQNMKSCNEHPDCTEHLLSEIIKLVKAGGRDE